MQDIVVETMDREMSDVLARKTEAERLQISWGMWRSARKMLLRLVRSEHADWSITQVETEVARRISGGA